MQEGYFSFAKKAFLPVIAPYQRTNDATDIVVATAEFLPRTTTFLKDGH